jgi:hypothetical protein
MDSRLPVCSMIAALSPLLSPGQARAAEPSIEDCLAANHASIKLDSDNKLRAERAQLLICAAESCPAEIRLECAKRVDQVNQALPSIVFDVKDGTGADASAVKIAMDGEVVADRLRGTAIALDPGEHQFTFEIAGEPPLTKRLMVRVSEQNRRETIAFPPLASRVTATQPAPQPPENQQPKRPLSGQRIAALAAGGVGVAGVVIGSVFGLEAKSRKTNAEGFNCSNGICRTQDGVDAWSSARTAGTVSTVAFIVGGVGLATAATLWFTDKPSSERPQMGLGLSGIQLRGTW